MKIIRNQSGRLTNQSSRYILCRTCRTPITTLRPSPSSIPSRFRPLTTSSPTHRDRAIPVKILKEPPTTATTPDDNPDHTYQSALVRLQQLESNNALATQFHLAASSAALNERAIPEMTMWLHRAGYTIDDLRALRCVHIAGTKGKGSTAAYTASILKNWPGRTGLVGRYTSPHLISVRERIAIDGRPISRELFTKYFFELWERLSEASRAAGDAGVDHDGPGTKPAFFRFLTLLAFHVFLREGVRDVVVECGIGGEYDATNILPAEAVSASVITHLGIDHTEFLGTTLDEITWHKGGIFKKNVPAFINELENSSQQRVIDTRAEWRETPLTVIPSKDIKAWETLPGALLDGPVQKNNRILALAAACTLMGRPFDPAVPPAGYEQWIIDGLTNAYLRGRCEIVTMPDGLQIYLDGAHTIDSIRETVRWFVADLRDNDTPMLIFNQQSRDPEPLIATMMSEYAALTSYRLIFRRAFFSRNDTDPPTRKGDTRSMRWQERAQAEFVKFSPKTKTLMTTSVLDAIKGVYWQSRLMSNRKERPKVLVTGSLYLVGAALRVLRGDLDAMD